MAIFLLPREAVESKQILTVLVLNYLNHLALSLKIQFKRNACTPSIRS